MKRFFFFLLVIFGTTAAAQSEAELMALGIKYDVALNENAAFETFRKVVKLNPRNYQALWRLSELYSRIGNRQPTEKGKQDFFITGRQYAEQAIKVNPSGADGYYALSVAMGRLALTQSGRNMINAVKDIRANAEKALRLDPNHFRAWHVMGKWHYEVSGLNLFERTGVKLIYGGLPPASLEKSIQAYEKSRQLEPHFALNYLELAKAYERNGQDAKAVEILRKLPAIPVKTADDARIKKEGAQLLKELTN